MAALLFLNNFILGSLPTLGGLRGWVTTEGGNAVALVCVGFTIFYLIKQSWGKMIGFLLVAALVFFTVGNPEKALNSFKKIIDMILGG
ncbi:TcpD family membrane protein [Bacillus cereus]|uniref:TcpD family membrane protein n=1 Tax=Bacillus cereus group TaxID=86661 RepID=UPI000BEC4947|nr:MULTISPECIES: TcpD family membrane protein [Bacillus cereus group]MED1303716.1 TcpD family membrane protein [Bacillus pacificus]MCJ0851527.1 TcpD family membrane protein [Bacillus cereus]MDF9597994.1 TcpD family membrane protein [Bacillus cereus]MDF9610194.1 TcpD family membrane protein [Bacillus cereus]MDF9661128.1 TcpD family membrane protein [Bacillus cereus]